MIPSSPVLEPVPLHPADTITPFLFARFLEDDLAVEAIRDGGYQDAAWTSEPSRSGSWANLIAHSRTLGQHDDEPPEATRVGFIAAGRNEHDHVVRWDPARVRAELLARRQTLVHHRPTDVQTCFGDSPSPDLRCLVCHNAGTMLRWPCLTVRLLALPHTAHPGFEPGWTV